jgi:hypothetical protein
MVVGNLFCKNGSLNNKVCDTSMADPKPIPLPITDDMIDKWKIDAEAGGVISGDLTINSPTILGPKKITGNLIVKKDLTLADTVYVMGRIITSNGVHISLSSSYGANSGILLTDGYVDLSNNVYFEGSGNGNSFVMLVTTSSCPNIDALEILNNADSVILVAQNGTAHLSNNIIVNEVVADKIIMDNNAKVDYLPILENMSFSSGANVGWSIKNWSEVK